MEHRASIITITIMILIGAMVNSTENSIAQLTGSYTPQPDLLRAKILSNGSIVPATANITQYGNTYILTSDLDGYVLIERNECVFDGNGYSVYGVYGPVPVSVTSQVAEVRDVTVKNTVVAGGGIIFYGHLKSNNLIIANNTVNSGTGIDCSGNGNLVANNFINKGRGISVAGNWNIISGNNLQGCDQWSNPVPYGISLYGSSNKIFANTIVGTKGYAIDLLRVTSRPANIVAGNQIENNQVGIHTEYAISQGGAEGNLIYKNNFVGNGRNVYNEAIVTTVVSVNFWDDGKDGNYWSNYRGQGTYVIDQSNVDNHPLSFPVDIINLSIDTLSSVPSSTPLPTPTSTYPPIATPTPTPLSSPIPNATSGSPTAPIPTINTGPHIEPFPTLKVLVVSLSLLAVVIAFVLLYRRQRKIATLGK